MFDLDDDMEYYNQEAKQPIPVADLKDSEFETYPPPSRSNLQDIPVKKQQEPVAKPADFEWVILLNQKRYGPYTKAKLAKLIKAKKIPINVKLEGKQSGKIVEPKDLFKIKAKDMSSKKMLEFLVYMALSDGHVDDEEMKLLDEFCNEHNLAKDLLDQLLISLKKAGPPPIEMIGKHYGEKEFKELVKLAKADGKLSGTELRMLKKVFSELQKKTPSLQGMGLNDYL